MCIKKVSVQEYLAFAKECYQKDIWFKDNKTAVIKMLTHPRSAFYRNSQQQIVGLFCNNKLLTGSIFICHQQYPGNLMMAFFESMAHDPHYLKELVDYAKGLAADWNCKRLIAGLDGHIAFSIGYLDDNTPDFPFFGQSYNPAFYGPLFTHFGFEQTKLISYRSALSDFPISVYELNLENS